MENRNAWINRPGRTHKEQGRCDAAGSLGVNVTLTPEEKKNIITSELAGGGGRPFIPDGHMAKMCSSAEQVHL